MRVGQGSPGALRTHRYSNCLFSSVFFAGSKQDAKFDGTSVGSMDRLALESLGDRTFKLGSGTTSEPGRYVKSLGEPVAGKMTSYLPGAQPAFGLSQT